MKRFGMKGVVKGSEWGSGQKSTQTLKILFLFD